MSHAQIIKSMPKELKQEIKKGFNTASHAAVYAKLEAYLGEHHCIYEDGHVYTIAKKIAGVL